MKNYTCEEPTCLHIHKPTLTDAIIGSFSCVCGRMTVMKDRHRKPIIERLTMRLSALEEMLSTESVTTKPKPRRTKRNQPHA